MSRISNNYHFDWTFSWKTLIWSQQMWLYHDIYNDLSNILLQSISIYILINTKYIYSQYISLGYQYIYIYIYIYLFKIVHIFIDIYIYTYIFIIYLSFVLKYLSRHTKHSILIQIVSYSIKTVSIYHTWYMFW